MAAEFWRATAALLVSFALTPGTAGAQVKVTGLSPTPPDRIAIYTVRGPGVTVPYIAFQERARRTVEAYMHAELVSMDEALSRGGPDLSKRLGACRGDPHCFAEQLTGAVDARYLLLISASRVGDARLVGARLLDLEQRRTVGESIDEVPANRRYSDVVPNRIRRSVPAERWKPFGQLSIDVNPSGAQISIDGRIVGLSPMQTIKNLLPGRYRLSAEKTGYRPAQATIEVVRRRRVQAGLSLEKLPESDNTMWWVIGGVSVAAIAAAVTVGVVLSRDAEDPGFCSAPDPASCR